MAKQIDKHEFSDGVNKITVALLDDGSIRVRFHGDRRTSVTWHATGNDKASTTIISPEH